VTTSTALRFDSGRLCLDLLATVGAGLSPDPVERLDSPQRLAEWLTGSGLAPPGQALPVDQNWAAEFRALRTLIGTVVRAELVGQARPAALRMLNQLAATPSPAIQVVRVEGTLRRALRKPITCAAMAAAVCQDAIDLLTGPDRALMRTCADGSCAMVYLDTSRGGRRQWCSSALCGNRRRVAQYRARHLGD
jgi:predicted RNA-binding Zn ribbon-like protein